MNCPYCGTPNAQGSVYCARCGRPMAGQAPMPQPVYNQSPPLSALISSLAPSEKYIFFGAVAAMIIGAIALFQSSLPGQFILLILVTWIAPSAILIWSVTQRRKTPPTGIRRLFAYQLAAAAWGGGISALLVMIMLMAGSIPIVGAVSQIGNAQLAAFVGFAGFGSALYGAFLNSSHS
jgi:hypothetical protein